MPSKYTLMNDPTQLEAYVKNTEGFIQSVRFEPHEEREGYLILTDGSFSFGMMTEENVAKVLSDEVDIDSLSNKPQILKYLSCYDINRNTKAYERESSKTAMDKFDEKVSSIAPNRKKLVWLAVIVVIAIGAPFISMKIFSQSSSGYSESFYDSDRVNNRLLRFRNNWKKFVETEATYDEKVADHLTDEILKFSEEVEMEKLDAKQKEALQWLVNRANARKGK